MRKTNDDDDATTANEDYAIKENGKKHQERRKGKKERGETAN